KDLIILRGINHFPEEIEQTATRVTAAEGRVVAFDVDGAHEAHVVVLQEVDRRTPPARLKEMLVGIRRAMSEEHGIASCVIGLVPRGPSPLTTSGKVRRGQCRSLYLEGHMSTLADHRELEWSEPRSDVSHQGDVETVVRRVLGRTLGIDPSHVEPAQPLARY